MHILAWFYSKPKITGRVEQSNIGTANRGDDMLGAHVMLQVYLVNMRLRPTTVRGWKLKARLGNEWREAETWVIPDNFSLNDNKGNRINVDFASSRLYDKAAEQVLEYGKGIRGWLRFMVPGVSGDDLRNDNELLLEITDAFGGKHRIKHRTGSGTAAPSYYPGAGIRVS